MALMHCRALVVFGLLIGILSGCRADASGVAGAEVWRFAIEEPRGSVQDAYAQRFKSEVERRTNGAVKVVVYPYGALGTSDHLLEQVHGGTLQFAMSSPGHLGKIIPSVQVFLLHFLLGESDAADVCALNDPTVRAPLGTLYRQKGLAFLDAFTEGSMVWTTRKPVRSPDDFRDTKFRVMTSPLLIAAYDAYGASPTPLPYSEVYSALQLRVVDGQVNPVFAVQEMSFHEVTDWLIFPRHAAFVTTVIGNPRFLAALGPTRRALVEEVIATLHREIDGIQRDFNAQRLARILEQKPTMRVVELTTSEREAFRLRAQPVRQRFIELAGRVGEDLLQRLEAAIARCGT